MNTPHTQQELIKRKQEYNTTYNSNNNTTYNSNTVNSNSNYANSNYTQYTYFEFFTFILHKFPYLIRAVQIKNCNEMI